MDFMGPANPPRIPIVRIAEHFEALVDKNIVYQEVGSTVNQDAQPDRETVPEFSIVTEVKEPHTYNGIEYKKGIIPFEPGVVVFPVVILMQGPQKPVHHILVRGPGHEFHDAEGEYENKDPDSNLHLKLI